MLDLNLNVASTESTRDSDSSTGFAKFNQGSGNQIDESETSNSSIVNEDEENSNSTPPAVTFSFDILKIGSGGDGTRELFPAQGGGEGQSSGNKWIDLSFERKGGGEVTVTPPLATPQVKKSRRGPRSRSSVQSTSAPGVRKCDPHKGLNGR